MQRERLEDASVLMLFDANNVIAAKVEYIEEISQSDSDL
jgi:hypothetical protein